VSCMVSRLSSKSKSRSDEYKNKSESSKEKADEVMIKLID
jgi:hypothetical protein